MTVLFCDLVGSTPLAESLDAEDFQEVLDRYQWACARAVERFGGYTAKYLGDGVMAYFGYPQAHEDDPQCSVRAGLETLAALERLNSELGDRLGVSLQARIGLHTGVVVAGEMGVGRTGSRLEIAGEAPHIAARLQSIAPPGSVVISEATRGLVEGYFEMEALGAKTLRGISRSIVVHRVLRPTGAMGRIEVAATRRLTPLVGRGRELERLAKTWEGVESGRGAIAHVAGEAGIGKSRLVHELIESLGARIGAQQVCQCSPHHRNTALYPIARLLERRLGFDRAQGAEDQRGRLQQAVARAGGDVVAAVPLLADLLSLGEHRSDVGQNLAPRDARTEVLRSLESVLVTDPSRHPLLFVVEDLHWADPTTVELLGRIVALLPDIPVMCLLTFRREFEPPWSQPVSAVEVGLEPLSSREVRGLAKAASETPLGPAVLDWVESSADGVPLFVEEMLNMLEHASPPETPHHAEPPTGVPRTLAGLFVERLDRLPELGEVIDLAAILGRELDVSLLVALEPLDGSQIEPALTRLVGEDVLRPLAGSPSRYEFTHALLQEAAYGRILHSRRRVLHARVAATIVHSFPALAEREPEVVAQHWSRAADPAKAVPFWRAAARRALERAAYLEAAEHFRHGLEALDAADRHASDEYVDFLIQRAASLQAGRGYAAEGVDDAYTRARVECARPGNENRLLAVIRGQWMFHVVRGQYATALELADEMLALGERVDGAVPLAEGHLYRGLAHMYLGDLEVAHRHLDDAFLGSQRPDRSDQVYAMQGDTGVGALAYLALVLWNLGHADQSRERSDLSLRRAEQAGGPVTRAQAWGMRSILHLSRQEPGELREWTERTRAHSVEYNIGYWRAVSSLFSGWVQGRGGQLEPGIAQVEETLEAYLQAGFRHSLAHFHILLADLRLAAGDRRRALDSVLAAEEYIAETSERFSESELFRFKARALMAGDRPDSSGATTAYERAVTTAREQNAKLLELRALTRLAMHQSRIGEPCTALPDVRTLCEWFASTPDLPDVARARALVASQLAAR